MLKVTVVDPPAYTPPYDHALCSALAGLGAQVTLQTSRFAYDDGVAAPIGYSREESFYPLAIGNAGSRLRQLTKAAQHPLGMRQLRKSLADSDVAHFQWLTLPQIDLRLLPQDKPLVITAHDVLPREPTPGQVAAQARIYKRFDAVVVHSQHGKARLINEANLDEAKIHVIPHGAFDHLTLIADHKLPSEFAGTKPETFVTLFFGLIRPYKGVDLLLDAWRLLQEQLDPEVKANQQLWVVGLPKLPEKHYLQMTNDLPAGVKVLPRFVSDAEMAGILRRADLVTLPYREIDQSGVLFSAMAFGKPMLLSDVGGFPEVAAQGAAECFAAGDVKQLAASLQQLSSDPVRRDLLTIRCNQVTAGEYSWRRIGQQHLDLYRKLI